MPGAAAKKRRWRRSLLIVAVVATAGYLFRAPLLCALAGFLVVEQTVEAADYVLPVGSIDCSAEAARLCQSGSPTHVLLIETRPGILQRMAVLPPREAVDRRTLAAHGVADEAVTVVPCDSTGDGDCLRCLGEWLGQHPDARVTLVCDRFVARRWRLLCRAVLPEEAAGRVGIHPLPRGDQDEANWWRDKDGLLDVFDGYMGYGYVKLFGEGAGQGAEWDPDDYEKGLR